MSDDDKLNDDKVSETGTVYFEHNGWDRSSDWNSDPFKYSQSVEQLSPSVENPKVEQFAPIDYSFLSAQPQGYQPFFDYRSGCPCRACNSPYRRTVNRFCYRLQKVLLTLDIF